MTEDAQSVVFMRARRGVIEERHRVVHVLPASDARNMLEFLTAFCDTRIRPADVEIMNAPTGMPCVVCLARVGVFQQTRVSENIAPLLIDPASGAGGRPDPATT